MCTRDTLYFMISLRCNVFCCSKVNTVLTLYMCSNCSALLFLSVCCLCFYVALCNVLFLTAVWLHSCSTHNKRKLMTWNYKKVCKNKWALPLQKVCTIIPGFSPYLQVQLYDIGIIAVWKTLHINWFLWSILNWMFSVHTRNHSRACGCKHSVLVAWDHVPLCLTYGLTMLTLAYLVWS